MHLYCTATNTGKDFFTADELKKFSLRGFPGNIWVVENNSHGAAWISKVSGTTKTLEEAQAIYDAEITAGQTAWDALSDEEKELRSITRPVITALPNEG